MELLPISALQHLLYCERQCALIHVEQVWAENQFTAEGQVMHEKAHEGPDEMKAGVRIARGLAVKSEALGLSGQCDVVEFHLVGTRCAARDFSVLPIEYKRGKPKAHRADEVQLCAQAMCLEEMLCSRACQGVEQGICVRQDAEPSDHPLARAATIESPDHLLAKAATKNLPDHVLAKAVTIHEGRLYYGQTRRRVDVVFDDELRDLTARAARRLREMIESRETPPAVYEERKCEACSLKELCLPKAMRFQKGAGAWFARQMAELAAEGGVACPQAAASPNGALGTTRPTNREA
jgi:CRISPR-associated exonuclease Cas4